MKKKALYTTLILSPILYFMLPIAIDKLTIAYRFLNHIFGAYVWIILLLLLLCAAHYALYHNIGRTLAGVPVAVIMTVYGICFLVLSVLPMQYNKTWYRSFLFPTIYEILYGAFRWYFYAGISYLFMAAYCLYSNRRTAGKTKNGTGVFTGAQQAAVLVLLLVSPVLYFVTQAQYSYMYMQRFGRMFFINKGSQRLLLFLFITLLFLSSFFLYRYAACVKGIPTLIVSGLYSVGFLVLTIRILAGVFLLKNLEGILRTFYMDWYIPWFIYGALFHLVLFAHTLYLKRKPEATGEICGVAQ